MAVMLKRSVVAQEQQQTARALELQQQEQALQAAMAAKRRQIENAEKDKLKAQIQVFHATLYMPAIRWHACADIAEEMKHQMLMCVYTSNSGQVERSDAQFTPLYHASRWPL